MHNPATRIALATFFVSFFLFSTQASAWICGPVTNATPPNFTIVSSGFPPATAVTTGYAAHISSTSSGTGPVPGQVVTCCKSMRPFTPPCKEYTWATGGFSGGTC